ncbi:MAG: hypothetical protein OXC69_09440 [Candidatus Tectomicrobia bacterium]|nr:hypothetical protein [Candidatus Tectomicrobia bacterium]
MVGRRSCCRCLAILGFLVVLFAPLAQGQQHNGLSITHQGFNRPQARGRPLAIEATITTSAGIAKARVFCRSTGSGDFMALPMAHVENDLYRAVVPDWLLAGSGLEYYIEVTDGSGEAASQGFRGFPLQVRLVSAGGSSQEERLKALQNALDLIREQKRPVRPNDRYDRSR